MDANAVTDPNAELAKSPIIEAVVDIDCDMPVPVDATALQANVQAAFSPTYPTALTVHQDSHRIQVAEGAPVERQSERRFEALRLSSPDNRALVQVRVSGFSFNRLAPYSTLDAYLPEIERTWRLFVQVAEPVRVRAVRLRYINRILIPFDGKLLQINQYISRSPELPDEANLSFLGFLNQHLAVEQATGNLATTVLMTQPPEPGFLPVIFDIQVTREQHADVGAWPAIAAQIASLRSLKNRIFAHTITDKCRRLFHP